MISPHIPQPQFIRTLSKSFAWIDSRLMRDGYLPIMTPQDQSLYLFLVLAADHNGVSFYRQEKICDPLGLGFREFRLARSRLVAMTLIAFSPYHAHTPNGYYQVLPINGPPPTLDNDGFNRIGMLL